MTINTINMQTFLSIALPKDFFVIRIQEMKPLIIDSSALSAADKNQDQFTQLYSRFEREQNESKQILPEEAAKKSIQSIMGKLEKTIQLRDQCKDSKKVVSLCLIFIKQAFVNHKQEFNDLQYELIKNYLQKNIKYLSEQQQIEAYISLISLYRRLSKKQQLQQASQSLLRTLLRFCPPVQQKERTRLLILQIYEQLFNDEANSDLLPQFLRYELSQPSPNYQYMIDVLLRHFPESKMPIPLYLLLGKYEDAKKLLQYFGIIAIDNKKMLQLLGRVIALTEKNSISGLKNLYESEIRSYKLSNFNIVMKAFLKRIQYSHLKQQYHHQ